MTPDQEAWNARVEAARHEHDMSRLVIRRPPAPRLPGSHRPFKHAKAYFMKVLEIRQEHQFNLAALQQALGELPPYVGRGHGGKHRTRNRRIGGAWSQDRSKPYPNPGRSEAARRVFQALPAAQRAYIRSIEKEVTE